ncbi:unnamed protein product [Boreogadus saida]
MESRWWSWLSLGSLLLVLFSGLVVVVVVVVFEKTRHIVCRVSRGRSRGARGKRDPWLGPPTEQLPRPCRHYHQNRKPLMFPYGTKPGTRAQLDGPC